MQYRKPHIPDFRVVAGVIRREAHAALEAGVEKIAEREREEFVRRIKRQQFPAFEALPLSPAWLSRKRKARADERTMIATGHYIHHIRVLRRRTSPKSLTLHVGFRADALARDLHGRVVPFPLHLVAAVQEFGSERANIPPRPHWGPHLKDMHRRAGQDRKALAEGIVARINRELKRRMR